MRHRRQPPISELRQAVDCLPIETRTAMLEGVRTKQIIVGAYVDRRGGVCPMLAAHRCGGRTDFHLFARAWDRFAQTKRARRATERELRVLTAQLEASILAEESVGAEFKAAIADHRALADRSARERAARRRDGDPRVDPAPARVRPGDPDRSQELSHRGGWSWLRPFRRLDEYELALRRLEEAESAQGDSERSRATAGV